MKIKICGMKYPENISEIIGLEPDYIGFIFYPSSKRFVESVPEISSSSVKKVGVFVNDRMVNIIDKTNLNLLDYVQLHGDETADYCEKLKRILPYKTEIIKAFQITEQFDFDVLKAYEKYCSIFLFDTPSLGYGGSGKSFDWDILKQYNLKTPFFLSGGIGLHNIDDVLNWKHDQLIAYDFNSKLESEPGLKNKKLVEEILNKVRTHDYR